MTNKTKLTATTATAVTAPATPIAKSPSKSLLVVKLLGRAKGATIAEIGEPTGWQPHSARAYLSGLRKKGRTVVREQRKTGETAYRIVDLATTTSVAEPMSVGDAPSQSIDNTEVADRDGDITDASAHIEGNANVDAAAAANLASA